MPATFNFYKLSEKKPNHNESIIWLKPCGPFDYSGFDPMEVCVEYSWIYIDENGEDTGEQCIFESLEDFSEDEARLMILADGWEMMDNHLWCSVEDYWKSLDEAGA